MVASLLNLPPELRQIIFLYTVSDEDLFSRIELRAQRRTDNNRWKAKWSFELSRLPVPYWAYAHSTFAADLLWVKEQWTVRATVLGHEKERAWNAIFGER